MTASSASEHQRYQREAELLGSIGAALFGQPATLSMRLPRELAKLALAAWRRHDDSDSPEPETTEQRITRHRAGTLALIGLCIEQTGRTEGDDIVCELDAWYVGGALEAADDYGLLAGRTQATSHRKPGPTGSRATE